ncbi:MAG: hypothetical protein H0U05_06675 [Actinobacteria bacterium]|nr:hypothetical protein [Actinomycetota bacterium]
MNIRALIAAAFTALVTASEADAAMCIRLSTPAKRSAVGDATIIEMKTFVPLVGGGLQPWIVRGYPFRVEAVSARGQALRVKVKPSRNPYAWRGVLRFPQAGVWTVRVRNFGPRYQAGCGEELRVRVRSR